MAGGGRVPLSAGPCRLRPGGGRLDAALLTAALAGTLAGVAASAIPGLHVNTLALVALAAAPAAGPWGAAFLVAAFAAGAVGVSLPATLLGAGADDGALQGLPAHALAKEGRAVEAIALQAWGAFAGVLVALPLAAAAAPLVTRLGPWLPRILPWLLLVILLLLVLSQPARERTKMGARGLAILVLALAGLLGLAVFAMGARSPLGLPSSPLLPLLAGLFALPLLVDAARVTRARPRPTMRAPLPPRGEVFAATAPGAAVAALVGLAPGLSASHAALLTPSARTPERALLRLAAVTGGAVVFTLLAWHALGKARSGALVAAQAWAAPERYAGLSPALADEAALVVLAAALACLFVRALSRPLARATSRRPPAVAARVGLALVILSVAVFNGALGVVELAAAGLVGRVPGRLGVRRSLAMGAILVPVALRAWGLA